MCLAQQIEAQTVTDSQQRSKAVRTQREGLLRSRLQQRTSASHGGTGASCWSRAGEPELASALLLGVTSQLCP